MNDVFSMAAMGSAGNANKAAKVTDTVIIDLANAALDKTGTVDAAPIIQQYIDRALRDYVVQGRSNKTYLTVELVIPIGSYKINQTVVIDCVLPNNKSAADTTTLHIRGGGGGTSGTVISLGPDVEQMFDMKYGQIRMDNLKFFGRGTAIFAKVGRPQRETGGSNPLGDVMVKQSTFSNCEWFYWNKVFEIGHMFDVAFYNCGMFNFGGTSPVAIDVLKHAEDPTNNLMFYRCHIEQLPGGTLFRSTGGATANLQHNNYAFFGCHFEARNWDSTLVELEGTHRVGFYNCQFTHNNTQGADRGITEAQVSPMFKLRTVSSVEFVNCTITRQGIVTPANVVNKVFELGSYVSGLRVNGGVLDAMIGIATASVNDLWQSSASTPYVSNGESPIQINGPIVDPLQPPLFTDKLTLSSPAARNRKWGIQHVESNNLLQIGYTSTQGKNFDFTNPALTLATDGTIRPRGYAGQKVSIANAGTATFAFSTSASTNQRGIFMVYADINLDAYVLFFSHGSAVFPINVGSVVTLSTTETSDANKLNVYLHANGSIIVKNLLGSSRAVSVIQFGF